MAVTQNSIIIAQISLTCISFAHPNYNNIATMYTRKNEEFPPRFCNRKKKNAASFFSPKKRHEQDNHIKLRNGKRHCINYFNLYM